MCILYNPNTMEAEAIIVNMPNASNVEYAYKIARKRLMENKRYTKVICAVKVMGEESNAKYVAFEKHHNKFTPKAIGDDARDLLMAFGGTVIVGLLAKLVINTLSDLISIL